MYRAWDPLLITKINTVFELHQTMEEKKVQKNGNVKK